MPSWMLPSFLPVAIYASMSISLLIISNILNVAGCPPVIADALPKALVIAAGKHKLSEHSDHRGLNYWNLFGILYKTLCQCVRLDMVGTNLFLHQKVHDNLSQVNHLWLVNNSIWFLRKLIGYGWNELVKTKKGNVGIIYTWLIASNWINQTCTVASLLSKSSAYHCRHNSYNCVPLSLELERSRVGVHS